MDQELKELFGQITAKLAETDAKLAETSAALAGTNATLAETATQSKATERTLAESRKEVDRLFAENARQIANVNKQVGELGNKFGTFAEGMAWPSVEKLLYGFGMTAVNPRQKFKLNGETLEADGFGWDSSHKVKEIYVVEVKSRLQDEEGIQQLLDTIAKLPRFFPVPADHQVYGVMAAVDISDNMRKKVLQKGLYLLQLADETFKLATPPQFKPHDYGPNAQRNGRANGHAKKRAK